MGGTLVRLGHSLARVKIWGRSTPTGPKYGLPKNALWVGMIQHRDLQGHWTNLYRLVSPNAGGIAVDGIKIRFWIYSSVSEIFAAELRSRPKSCQILHVFGPWNFFWGAPPKILDRHYKIRLSTDHRVKFQAGRPTHLGDLVLGKKNIRSKT